MQTVYCNKECVNRNIETGICEAEKVFIQESYNGVDVRTYCESYEYFEG